jgi:hypothetical protein
VARCDWSGGRQAKEGRVEAVVQQEGLGLSSWTCPHQSLTPAGLTGAVSTSFLSFSRGDRLVHVQSGCNIANPIKATAEDTFSESVSRLLVPSTGCAVATHVARQHQNQRSIIEEWQYQILCTQVDISKTSCSKVMLSLTSNTNVGPESPELQSGY